MRKPTPAQERRRAEAEALRIKQTERGILLTHTYEKHAKRMLHQFYMHKIGEPTAAPYYEAIMVEPLLIQYENRLPPDIDHAPLMETTTYERVVFTYDTYRDRRGARFYVIKCEGVIFYAGML